METQELREMNQTVLENGMVKNLRSLGKNWKSDFLESSLHRWLQRARNLESLDSLVEGCRGGRDIRVGTNESDSVGE